MAANIGLLHCPTNHISSYFREIFGDTNNFTIFPNVAKVSLKKGDPLSDRLLS